MSWAAERGAGNGRIAAIQYEGHLSAAGTLDLLSVIRRNYHSGAGKTTIDQIAQLILRIDIKSYAEVIRGAVRIQQGTCSRAAILIKDRQSNIANVVRGSVAQKKELHDGNDENQNEGTRITQDLDEFFAYEGS
jgi:hypothetical protein